MHLERGALERARVRGQVDLVAGDLSYASKLEPASGLCYSRLIPAGRLPAAMASAAHVEVGELRQSLAWFDPEYVLSVVPLVFAVPPVNPTWHSIDAREPLSVDELLKVFELVNAESLSHMIVKEATTALHEMGILSQDDVLRTIDVSGALAVQIWDLRGSRRHSGGTRASDEPYVGLDESRHYAWDISALMAHSTDHVVSDGLWRRRSDEQVFTDVGMGFSVLGDHMVFINHTCCLEISHLPIDLRDRSSFRMEHYGYDSSSIFIWTVGNLRALVLTGLRERYRGLMLHLIGDSRLSSRELLRVERDEVRHQILLDRVFGFGSQLKEPRSRRFDQRLMDLRLGRDALASVRRDMERVLSLAAGLVTARDKATREKTNTLLATLAVAVALVGLPGLVDGVANWIAGKEWGRLGVTTLTTVVVVLLLGAVWRWRASN
jgi:hypothetical protein